MESSNRNTGTFAAPTWDVVGNVKDLTLNLKLVKRMYQRAATTDGAPPLERSKTPRSNSIWSGIQAMQILTTAIKDAFFNGTGIELAVMDGLITGVGSSGSQGLRATCRITTFSRKKLSKKRSRFRSRPSNVLGQSTDLVGYPVVDRF